MKNIIPTKTIFYGSCSGAYPALYFGCCFNKIVLCSNPYIYIDDIIAIYLKRGKIDPTTSTFFDIDLTIRKSPPEHIYLYSNEGENYLHKQSIKFLKYCKSIGFNNITHKFHNTSAPNISCHMFLTPPNETFESIMNIFKVLSPIIIIHE